jgi:O-antigen/teichoic acid export membrane protein
MNTRAKDLRQQLAGPRMLVFIGALAPTMAALVLQFGAFAITARGLGVDQFGRYAALLAIVGIGIEVVGWGGADLLVRAVSRDRARFGAHYGHMLLAGALTLPPVVLVGAAIALGPMRVNMALGAIVLALAAEMTVARMAASLELVMVAHGHNARAGWLRLATAAVRLLLALAYFWLMARHELAGWIVAVALQSVALTTVYAALGARLYGRPSWHLMRGEFRAGTAFSLNQTARAAQSNLDRMVLARVADDATLGAYGAASRFLQLGLFPMQVATRILYPSFFVHGASGIAASRRLALRVVPAMVAVGALSALAVAVAALFAPWLLGAEYASATRTASQLALALPLMALQYPAADALTGAGRQGLRAWVYGVAALLFGLLLAAGAAVGGTEGVIAAFITGHALLAGALWGCVYRCRDGG